MKDRVNPTQEDLENPLFNAIFDVIKTWDINTGDGYRGANGSDAKELLDKIQQVNRRAVACVNSCQGVPDDALEGRAMAKAWLAWQIWKKFGAYRHLEGEVQDVPCLMTKDNASDCTRINQDEVDMDDVISTALIMRDGGADFGELNALIDSFKEEA